LLTCRRVHYCLLKSRNEAKAMAHTAFQFPGQGSQYVGMGSGFLASSAVACDLFARAEDLLSIPLTSLCLDGPSEDLTRTENAQPAIYAVSAVALMLLHERGIGPVAVAGHSVGEYAALLASGALTFADGLRAVRRRGELMARAVARLPGAMAAIVGLPVTDVEALCAQASGAGVVTVANENGPLQTVVSGDSAAVERVLDLVDANDHGLGLRLDVDGAFHSPLMAPIVAEMAEAIDALTLREARVPVIATVTGAAVRTPDDIRAALVRQIDGRVRWGASIDRIVALGADRLVEVGPGRKLTRLARDIAPTLALVSAEELIQPTAGADVVRSR
jgi:[acyl-carrier-protein] S-malonyltransferase